MIWLRDIEDRIRQSVIDPQNMQLVQFVESAYCYPDDAMSTKHKVRVWRENMRSKFCPSGRALSISYAGDDPTIDAIRKYPIPDDNAIFFKSWRCEFSFAYRNKKQILQVQSNSDEKLIDIDGLNSSSVKTSDLCNCRIK